jgi:hypothetical protein
MEKLVNKKIKIKKYFNLKFENKYDFLIEK